MVSFQCCTLQSLLGMQSVLNTLHKDMSRFEGRKYQIDISFLPRYSQTTKIAANDFLEMFNALTYFDEKKCCDFTRFLRYPGVKLLFIKCSFIQ